MGHKWEAFSRGSRATGDGLVGRMAYHAQWPFSSKNTVVAIAVMALLAVAALGITHETTTPVPGSNSAHSRPPAAPPKPAFTRAEEAYIQALWPIHGEVERTTVRMSLGKIFYTTNDLGKADLKTRADAALATYRRAETQINTLQPPQSLAPEHDDYLAAVRLFEQSILEMLKMFDDGDDGHLLAAFPFNQEGTNKIRELGVRFWQDEFPPN